MSNKRLASHFITLPLSLSLSFKLRETLSDTFHWKVFRFFSSPEASKSVSHRTGTAEWNVCLFSSSIRGIIARYNLAKKKGSLQSTTFSCQTKWSARYFHRAWSSVVVHVCNSHVKCTHEIHILSFFGSQPTLHWSSVTTLFPVPFHWLASQRSELPALLILSLLQFWLIIYDTTTSVIAIRAC